MPNSTTSPVRAVGFVGLGDQGAPWPRPWPTAASTCTPGPATHAHTAHPDVASLIEAVDVLLLCVTDDDGVRALTGTDEARAALRPGQVVVNHGTGDPDENRAIAAGLATAGVHFIDAPVSGGAPGARTRTLTTMAGGDEDAFTACRSVFEVYSATVAHRGPVGSGQLTKLLNNSMTMSNLANAIDMATLAADLGLDLTKVIAVISASSGASASLRNLATADPATAGHLQSLYAKDIEHFADAMRARDLDPARLHDRGRHAAEHLEQATRTLSRHCTGAPA
ncbi:NAD(P)-dependent oxidoreductase [Streptomyces bauhiniae]|uniref:NAD(P)-dependent oxidoreductase n=1 Tax=Streptomyces bauhiniae TaxID=2340725 RepID=UPI0036549055